MKFKINYKKKTEGCQLFGILTFTETNEVYEVYKTNIYHHEGEVIYHLHDTAEPHKYPIQDISSSSYYASYTYSQLKNLMMRRVCRFSPNLDIK